MDKPIIRHCANCKYGGYIRDFFGEDLIECTVKYKKYRWFHRLRAELCKYYKERE